MPFPFFQFHFKLLIVLTTAFPGSQKCELFMCHVCATLKNKYIHIKLPNDAQTPTSSFFFLFQLKSQQQVLPSLYFDRISSFFPNLLRLGGAVEGDAGVECRVTLPRQRNLK